MKRLEFYGDNARAYNSREKAVLLSGPAGTGKSVALLAKCLTLLGKYPGARGLFLRKTRASLTESGLVTWERDILGPGHPVFARRRIQRRDRKAYRFANGSTFVVSGLDNADKVLSSDYDFAYLQEATDFTAADYETVLSRLRSDAMPYRQAMMDCNPTTPTHWLYQRQASGAIAMYNSRHQENPRFFNRATGEWTDAGKEYLGILDRMTGARRKRFLEGTWATAEGLVYDGFDPSRHLLPAGWQPPRDWPRVWAIDFGFTNPLVLQFWAVDPDGRMYLYRETYRTRVLVEELGRWAGREVERGHEPRPAAVVCDHDPENAAAFERHSGERTTPADKGDVLAGVQQVQSRFDLAGDGRPRIFFCPGLHRDVRDQSLVDAGRPIGLVEELAGYVWDTTDPHRPKDMPIGRDDHACDAMRYAARWVDDHLGPGRDGNYVADFAARPFDRLPSDVFG